MTSGRVAAGSEPTLTATDSDAFGQHDATTSVRIPDRLEQRYAVQRQLPERGAEALLLLARDRQEDREVVLKLYRRRVSRSSVMALVSKGAVKHIVKIHDYGVADGQSYEVLEWIPLGSMIRFVDGNGGQLGFETTVQVVDELAGAIHSMHELSSPPLAHADIKPANVLVRTEEPLDLVLADFGLATIRSDHLVSDRATPRWASPQSHKGLLMPEGDWWSLGAITYWCLTGRVLGGALEDAAYVLELEHRSVPLDGLPEDPDRDWSLLLRGLLTRSSSDRWGNSEVSAWLAGQQPALGAEWQPDPEPVAVTVTVEREADLDPIRFLDVDYATPRELGVALARHWAEAVDLLRSSAALSALTKCLADHAGATHDMDLVPAVERICALDKSAEYRTAALITRLAPGLTPTFRGADISRTGLAGLCDQGAAAPSGTAAAKVRQLAEQRLLPAYLGASGAKEYPRLADRWDAEVELWCSALQARKQKAQDDDWARARCLVLGALTNPMAEQKLRRRAQAAATPEANRQLWFRQLLAQSASHPGNAVAVLALAATAAQQTKDQRAEAEATAEARARARAARAVARTPRTRTMLMWCLLAQVPLAAISVVFQVLPAFGWQPLWSAAEVLEAWVFLGPLVGTWLAYATAPWFVLPLLVVSLLLVARSRPTREGNDVAVARHQAEWWLMEVAIVLTVMTVPVVVPFAVWSLVRAMRYHAPEEFRTRSALRNLSFVFSGTTLLYGVLLLLQVPPLGVAQVLHLDQLPAWAAWRMNVVAHGDQYVVFDPVLVATWFGVEPGPNGQGWWVMVTLLIMVGAGILWWAAANTYRRKQQVDRTLMGWLLPVGIIGTIDFAITYLWLGRALWLDLLIIGAAGFLLSRAAKAGPKGDTK